MGLHGTHWVPLSPLTSNSHGTHSKCIPCCPMTSISHGTHSKWVPWSPMTSNSHGTHFKYIRWSPVTSNSHGTIFCQDMTRLLTSPVLSSFTNMNLVFCELFWLCGLWRLIVTFLREIVLRDLEFWTFSVDLGKAQVLNSLSRLIWAEWPNVYINTVWKNGGKIRITLVCSMFIVNLEFHRKLCIR